MTNLLAQKSNDVTTKVDSIKERRYERDDIETKATHGEPHHKAFMLSKRQLACTEFKFISPKWLFILNASKIALLHAKNLTSVFRMLWQFADLRNNKKSHCTRNLWIPRKIGEKSVQNFSISDWMFPAPPSTSRNLFLSGTSLIATCEFQKCINVNGY